MFQAPPVFFEEVSKDGDGNDDKDRNMSIVSTQSFCDRLTLRYAKNRFGHLKRCPENPSIGTQVRLVCERQPRGKLAQANGLEGKVVGEKGRWIEVEVEADGAAQIYKTTLNNLRLNLNKE